MKRLILAIVILALSLPSRADPAPVIHYATAENLEHIDVALIDTAKRQIDLAAYVLTDWPVMHALTRAANRGVKVRIYLDGTQLADREPSKVFQDLAGTPGVEIRTKIATHHPRPVSETDEWLLESATEFCAALDRYAGRAMQSKRTNY